MNVFDPNTHIQTITVVGLGGTGAQVARAVARMVYDMRAARLHTSQIVLIDPPTPWSRKMSGGSCTPKPMSDSRRRTS